MVIPLTSAETMILFSSLAPAGQGDKGLSASFLISIMEQPLSSINALQLTLYRLAEICIFNGNGYNILFYPNPDEFMGLLFEENR